MRPGRSRRQSLPARTPNRRRRRYDRGSSSGLLVRRSSTGANRRTSASARVRTISAGAAFAGTSQRFVNTTHSILSVRKDASDHGSPEDGKPAAVRPASARNAPVVPRPLRIGARDHRRGARCRGRLRRHRRRALATSGIVAVRSAKRHPLKIEIAGDLFDDVAPDRLPARGEPADQRVVADHADRCAESRASTAWISIDRFAREQARRIAARGSDAAARYRRRSPAA